MVCTNHNLQFFFPPVVSRRAMGEAPQSWEASMMSKHALHPTHEAQVLKNRWWVSGAGREGRQTTTVAEASQPHRAVMSTSVDAKGGRSR